MGLPIRHPIPDASATAIVTYVLFEMVNYVEDDSLKQRHQREGEAMLTALCRPPYFTGGVETSCLLDHSVHYLPINSHVDVPAIFADYYFFEALVRYRGRHDAGTQ